MTADPKGQALAHWLNARRPAWQALEEQLRKSRLAAADAVADARGLLAGYRALVADLSLARRLNRDGPVPRYLENLYLQVHEQLYRSPGHGAARLADVYNRQAPQLLRELKGSLLAALAIFCFCIAAGWLMVEQFPELAGLFASPAMIEHVQNGKLWTDDLLNVTPSSLLSIGIAANNIAVTLTAFALGALYGVGTLYIVGLNGLMLGGIFAFTAAHGLNGRLFEFVIGHGVVELSVILIAAAMGLSLGEALIRPGNRNRLQAFQEVTLKAGTVLLAATPFLVVAGLIEGFVSPDPRFNLVERCVIGLCSGTVFWLTLLFGLPGRRPLRH
jgi:uncharacterized membrane protein SpoIIM required for sporulation